MSPELPMNNPYIPNDLIINYLGDYNKPKTNPINYNISNESIYDEYKSNISNNFMESRDTVIDIRGKLHYYANFFSRDIYKFVAIAILCYIILFYCIILLFQILN